MTDTTIKTKPWQPVFVFGRNDENCAVCDGILDENYLAAITLGVLDGGPACKECIEALGEPGDGLWRLAQGLNQIDSAIFALPQGLREPMVKRAHVLLDRILDWRFGPVTPEEKAEFVARMAAEDKMLRLPGGRCVKAREYDPAKHGAFLP